MSTAIETIAKIYADYRHGSQGMIKAIMNSDVHSAYDLTKEQAERLVSASKTAVEFEKNWTEGTF